MKSFIALLKKRKTYIGIGAALLFQLIFFTVWLTAYDGVYERSEQLSIAIVNEDPLQGKELTTLLKKNIPFQIEIGENTDQALKKLDKRELDMVIYIPKDFSQTLMSDEKAQLIYYINQANPSLSKQMMEATSKEITVTINQKLAQLKYTTLKEEIAKTLTQSPNPELAIQISENILDEVNPLSLADPITGKVVQTNAKEGFHVTMIPLMVVLASFIGAMVMSQYLQVTATQLITQFGKWTLFLSRQFLNVIVAISLSFLTIGLLIIFNIELEEGLLAVCLFQSVLFFSFLTLSQLFVILFGNSGMVFNIIATATQLVASGAIVPRSMLSSFYQKLGDFLPATYGVNGYFSLIYGGGQLLHDSMRLLLLIGTFICITVVGILFKKNYQIDSSI